MNGKTVAYIRVSGRDHNLARQASTIGEVDETFTDDISDKSRGDRPELLNMLRNVRHGDIVRVASMDRLAHSIIDLAELVEDMNSRGITIKFLAEGLTFGPGHEDGFIVFHRHLLGAVAQLERSLARDRQQEGIELAKQRGAYRGRSRKLTDDQVAHAKELLEAGVPKTTIAAHLECSRRVLYDALAGRGPYASPSL